MSNQTSQNAILDTELHANYVSSWDEGDVTSPCALNLGKLSIVDITISEDGEDNEFHIEDYVQVKVAGVMHILEASDGELTEKGSSKLTEIRDAWLSSLTAQQ